MIDNAYNSGICNATTGAGKQNHCGAGLRIGDFKLLVGFPGNDGWPTPPEYALAGGAGGSSIAAPNATCAPAKFLHKCLHVFQDQLSNFSSTSAAECCAACTANKQCGSWSLGVSRYPGTCFLKALTAPTTVNNPGCTSGISTNGPTPTPPCNTTTGAGCPCNPPSRGCLFNLKDDPNEHHDLANDPAHSADFERLLARLTEISKTGVVAALAMLGKKQVLLMLVLLLLLLLLLLLPLVLTPSLLQTGMDKAANELMTNTTDYFQPYAKHYTFVNRPAQCCNPPWCTVDHCKV